MADIIYLQKYRCFYASVDVAPDCGDAFNNSRIKLAPLKRKKFSIKEINKRR